MEALSDRLVNKKVWWHQSLWRRNLSARFANFYTFILEGIFVGVFSCYLVDIEENLTLSDAQLGTAVLFIYLGMVLASPFVAYLLINFGSQKSMFVGAVSFGITISFIPLANSFSWLIFTMFIYGLSAGVMDISMNSGAILTEIVAGKPLLGSFHGSYSVAAAVGSVIGGALKTGGFDLISVSQCMSIISVILTLIIHPNLYNFKQEHLITAFRNGSAPKEIECSPLVNKSELNNPESVLYSSHPDSVAILGMSPSTRIIAFYCMVGFLGAFGESSVVTWSVVYFSREMHVNSILMSLGFTCFMVCMALGRFCGDSLRRIYGRRWMVCGSGLLAFSGLCIVALCPSLSYGLFFGCVGFGVTGLGLSTLLPIIFSSAGHIPGGGTHAGASLALVSMFANSGAILSAPLVGLLAEQCGSMRVAFLCEAGLLGLLCLLSYGIPGEAAHIM